MKARWFVAAVLEMAFAGLGVIIVVGDPADRVGWAVLVMGVLATLIVCAEGIADRISEADR